MRARSDAELVDAARDGDSEAFGELVVRHHARVAGLCAVLLQDRSEAEDAAQDIFLKVHRSLEGFHGQARFSTWLYRIASNHCTDLLRQASRHRMGSLDAMTDERGEALVDVYDVSRESEPGKTHRSLSVPQIQRQLKLVQKLLAALPEGYRDALALRTQGLNYEEIADTLECSIDSVKARLRRARRMLSERLERLTPPEDVEASKGGGRL